MLWRVIELLAYILLAAVILWLLSLGFWGKLAVLVLGVSMLAVGIYYYIQLMREPWDEWDAISRDKDES
jgi:uncharacterized membrane protein HdeD (DUF308 family)